MKRQLAVRRVAPLTISLLAHGVLGVTLSAVPRPVKKSDLPATIVLVERESQPPVAAQLTTPPALEDAASRQNSPVSPLRPAPVKRRRRTRRQRARSRSVSPGEAPSPPSEPSAGSPDFGIQLEGTLAASGGPGVAVPLGTGKPAVISRGGPSREALAASESGAGSTAGSGAERGMQLPQIVRRVRPRYPDSVRGSGIEGEVILHLRIDARGSVVAVRLVRGLHPVLDREATRAARRTRFSPARSGGRPVATSVVYSFTFVLE